MSLEIIIGTDVAAANEALKPSLSAGLQEAWLAAEARILNLTSPLPNGADAIVALHPTGVNLCTDGVAASGAEGIAATRTALKAKQVAFFGAGEDIDAADQPFFFVRHGVRVALYAVCERESSGATERKAGANALDLVNLSDRVREIKSNCDRLIVLYYGGQEGYPYPTPKEQKVCRKIAECGASLVLSQGSHVIGCSERWNNTTIVYGQGAFLPGSVAKEETGLLVRYTIGDFGADTVGFVPVVSENGVAALAEEAKTTELLEGFEKRSLRVRVEGFVPARFESRDFCA
ncbi:MAG TPA: CapA family protein [Clostridia bacterium]|nr:CapA family protein [Clostridia bacterium]